MARGALGVVVIDLIVAALTFLPACSGAADQSELLKSRAAFAAALNDLNGVGQRLEAIQVVHGITKQYIGPSTSQVFIEALGVEWDVLGQIRDWNEILGGLVVAVNRVARNDGINTTFSEVREKLIGVDESLSQIQSVLAEHAPARAIFKRRLGEFADGLSGVDTGKRDAIRLVLDPARLDAELREQRKIIRSVLTFIAPLL